MRSSYFCHYCRRSKRFELMTTIPHHRTGLPVWICLHCKASRLDPVPATPDEAVVKQV